MSVRANWYLSDLDIPDGDPMLEIAQLQSEATMIDLTKGEAELTEDLAALVSKEARYFAYSHDNDGSPLHCDLKWGPEHRMMGKGGGLSCFNCPHFTDSREHARSLICTLGRAQEDIVEQIFAVRMADSLDSELAARFLDEIEESAALAEAVLS